MLQVGRNVVSLTALGPSNSRRLIGKEEQGNRENPVELHDDEL